MEHTEIQTKKRVYKKKGATTSKVTKPILENNFPISDTTTDTQFQSPATTLSPRRRAFYLCTLIFIFIIVVPFLILYSMGYTVNDALNLVRTGGIYIHSPVGSMNLYVNGNYKKTTGLFQKNTLIKDLRPGAYTITLEKEGYRTWKKTLRVLPNKVVEAYGLIVPNQFSIREISSLSTSTKTVVPSSRSLPSKKILSPEYSEAMKLFTATSTPLIASALPVPFASSTLYIQKDNIRVERSMLSWLDHGTLVLEWKGNEDSVPYFMCDEDDTCHTSLRISFDEPILYYEYYPGRDDVVVITTKSGVYIAELDRRVLSSVPAQATPVVYDIMKGNDLSFRLVSDSLLYIAGPDRLFAVSIQ